MRKKVFIVPHTHYDAEVFLTESETLPIGYANLIGAMQLLLEQPSFRFALDQSCFVEPFLQAYPEHLETLRELVRQGRLELVGGMHSMPDENIPSGESFIRNAQYGKNFFGKVFGVDVRTGWPIDTFGHHPQMPQLMRLCGFDHAAFQRLMPKDSRSEFFYQGLDGTRLLCHWMTCSYAAFWAAPANFYEFKRFADDRLHQLAARTSAMNLLAPAGADLTPVEPHILPMIAAFNANQDAYELVLATPAEYFQALRGEIDLLEALPTFCGDMNPIFQGTYSARIEIKQWNRRLETLLLNAEKLEALAQAVALAPAESAPSVAAAATHTSPKCVPAVANGESQIATSQPGFGHLLEAWRGVLFNQAHDDICGCHVDPVFHHVMDRFKYSQGVAQASLDESLQALVNQIDTRGPGTPVVVINTLGWERADVIETDVAFTSQDAFDLAVCDMTGSPVACDLLSSERYPNGSLKRSRVLFIARGVPAVGYAVYHILPIQEAEFAPTPTAGLAASHPYAGVLRFEIDRGWLENDSYRLEFDLWKGVITRLYDKVNDWEVISAANPIANTVVQELDSGNFWTYNGPCKGDEFYPMADRYPLPGEHDNHVDYAHQYLGDGVIHQGRNYVQFSIDHPYGTGRFATRVRLYAGLPRIDIQTKLINQDEKVRYRAVFPTSLADGAVTYEIPFGAIERPEGEYPAQNWIDYSTGEGSSADTGAIANDNSGNRESNRASVRGLSLLNLGLPGNNVVDGVMLLSLLKCTALEGGYGDMKLGDITQEGFEKGKQHVFDYALLPHAGDWRQAQAYRRGAEFNTPLLAVKAPPNPGSLPACHSFLAIGAPNIVLSSVTACPGGMVIRMYEAEGRPAQGAAVTAAWPIAHAWETNLLQQEPQEITLAEGGRLVVDFGPFEIKTLKLIF